MLLYKALSRLPLSVLYTFSHGLFFILYYILRYRRKVSLVNIQNSFPDKNPKQIKNIQKDTYRYLCDSFFEVIKAYSISKQELLSRVEIQNIEAIKKITAQGKPALLLSAHTAPTEWIGQALHLHLGCYVDPVYKPAHSKIIDQFVFATRSRYQATPIPYKKLARDIIARKNVNRCVAILADLAPRRREQAINLNFLNQPTRFFLSIERIAKLADIPVFFIAVQRSKRGYYQATVHTLCEQPSSLENEELVKMYVQHVQDIVTTKPEAWLWTHRRWKHPVTQ